MKVQAKRKPTMSKKKSAGSQATSQDGYMPVSERLKALNDEELWYMIQFVYPLFKNLIKQVAINSDVSLGHVQRVLENERKSPDMIVAITKEVRARMQGKPFTVVPLDMIQFNFDGGDVGEDNLQSPVELPGPIVFVGSIKRHSVDKPTIMKDLKILSDQGKL